MKNNESRYLVLDSYRALAALLVVSYHYFYRWVNFPGGERLIPPTPILSDSVVVAHGFLGVEFFFIISGFVIAMTLRTTRSYSEFALKRFARLFPAMLVCSVTTFALVSVFQVMPLSDVKWIDFIPSLTFISPQIINKIFGIETQWISGVYWSLFVEVKFYVVAALVYFASPERFLRRFFALTSLLCGIYWIAVFLDQKFLENALNLFFFPRYAFFFTAGIAFNQLMNDGPESKKELFGALLLSFVYSEIVYSPLNGYWPTTYVSAILVAVFFMLFILFVRNASLLAPLRSKWLAAVGAASYSLYLLHEGIGVSAIHFANAHFGTSVFWVFLIIVAVIALSIGFYKFIETPARRIVRAYSVR